jgi:hypothetical protein
MPANREENLNHLRQYTCKRKENLNVTISIYICNRKENINGTILINIGSVFIWDLDKS